MLSIPHMIVVFVIVLVVFGPQKLPELARGLGKLMAEFRKASTDFKSAFEEEMRDLERQAREVERRKAAETAAASAAAAQPATYATPSGAETAGSGPSLADSSASTEADTRQTEAPVIMPPAEGNIARSEPPLPPELPSEEPPLERPHSEKASLAQVTGPSSHVDLTAPSLLVHGSPEHAAEGGVPRAPDPVHDR